MKEHKYRAWDTVKKVMYSAYELGQDQETLSVDGRGFVNVSGDDTRLSQFHIHLLPLEYTGLKDKNGKEIYEGDITNHGIVEWCECLNWDSGGSNHPGFYFKDKYEYGDRGDLDYHTGFDEDIEVIGNIYENPELLEVKDE